MDSGADIRSAIVEALGSLGISDVDFTVEYPPDMAHGDYASNVAFAVAQHLGKSPREVAQQVRAELEKNIPKHVERVEVAGGGFINFYLSRDFFAQQVRTVLEQKEDWGKNKTLAGKKVMVEYTSPNLFKPLHVGNLMSNIVGESLTRLLECSGAEVKRFAMPPITQC